MAFERLEEVLLVTSFMQRSRSGKRAAWRRWWCTQAGSRERTTQIIKVQHALHGIGLPVVEDGLRLPAEYLAYAPHGWESERNTQEEDCRRVVDGCGVISRKKYSDQTAAYVIL